MIYITRRLEFCASHRLFNPKFSDKKNEETFGLCNNPNGHGHNYVLEVTVSGEIDPETGMVLDLKTLKKLINREIVDKVDHKNLNLDVDFMEGVIPTAENIAIKFWEILESKIDNGTLHELKLFESERNYVVYRGN
jgi:6-pyruvoyltetrahydropterin/6-carboxytetrahydropterin synthase